MGPLGSCMGPLATTACAPHSRAELLLCHYHNQKIQARPTNTPQTTPSLTSRSYQPLSCPRCSRTFEAAGSSYLDLTLTSGAPARVYKQRSAQSTELFRCAACSTLCVTLVCCVQRAAAGACACLQAAQRPVHRAVQVRGCARVVMINSDWCYIYSIRVVSAHCSSPILHPSTRAGSR